MATPQELIDQIIQNAMDIAEDYTDKVDEAAQDLIAVTGGAYFTPPPTETGFEPEAIEPDIPTVVDTTKSYEYNLELIVKLLSDELADFFATYYPLDADAFDEAQAWLVNVITNGGTGINADVEAQVWQRARDRIITEGSRLENQITVGYLAKNYSLPAGSMTKKIEEARMAQLGETSNLSSNIAIKQLEIEIENIKFAVTSTIDSRKMAMSAAADYIRAIASAPGSAVASSNLLSDAQAKMMSAASSWYSTRLKRDDLVLKSDLADMTAGLDLWKGQKGFAVDGSRVDASALGAAADAYGKSASAALSSLNSIVSTATNSFS